jgi:hypothetical protein
MTLLVGAVYPWKHLLKYPVFQALQLVQPARGVIIAADSRWTFPEGRTEDGAVKVFAIGTNAICAYAGCAIAGEDAIIALGKEVPTARTMEEWTRKVQAQIRAAWEPHQPGNEQLHILVGFSFPSGYAWLGHFTNDDDFQAHEVDDLVVLGPEQACTFFRQTLRAMAATILNRDLQSEALSMSIETWAMQVAVAVNDTCEIQAHPSVGGRFMSGITFLGEPQGLGVMRLDMSSPDSQAEQLGVGGAGQTVRSGFFWDAPPPDRLEQSE